MLTWKDINGTSEVFIIAELANNHSGDLNLARQMLVELSEIKKEHNFNIIVKFQYRNLDTYIQSSFKGNKEYKFIDRFESTKLEWSDFLDLTNFAKSYGLLTAATPFDELSISKVKEHQHDILKVASASSTDWNLLEECVAQRMPMVVSLGGLNVFEVDRVASFLKHRNADFALMHCVALYPTPDEKLNLGRIREIKDRYKVVTGFSTHEKPSNLIAGPLALASGAQIFERHYAKERSGVVINDYSSSRDNFENWLDAIENARQQIVDEDFQDNLLLQKNTLMPLKRGLYTNREIKIGEVIDSSNTYSAIPVKDGQLTSNELSLRTSIITKRKISLNEGIMRKDCSMTNKAESLEKILSKTRNLISKAGLTLGIDIDVEVSHHFGLSKFDDYGAVLIPVINREYAKKLVVMWKHQQHPEHFHKLKEETFVVLVGKLKVTLNGVEKIIEPGDVLLIPRESKHHMTALEDTVFEEISSTNYNDDSFYTDSANLDTERKTLVSIWF